jgi:NAD(P)H-flavin reductase
VQSSFPELDLNPEEDMVYLCGNPGMVDESFSDLKDRGFAIQRIVREKYISR